jgi:hypothetical protein
MHHAGLKKRWKYQVTTRIRKAHRLKTWRFPAAQSYLKDYPCLAAVLNKLWGLCWYGYIGASLLDPRFSVHYIGRYTKRAVLAEYRITYYDGKIIRFAYKDYAHGGKTSFLTMKVNTFIGRLIRHIPDRSFPMIRHAGLFSNRWKDQYLAAARKALNRPAETAAAPRPSPTWAERQEQYLGRSPLLCPLCQVPLMLVQVVCGPWAEVQAAFALAGRQNLIPTAVVKKPG